MNKVETVCTNGVYTARRVEAVPGLWEVRTERDTVHCFDIRGEDNMLAFMRYVVATPSRFHDGLEG